MRKRKKYGGVGHASSSQLSRKREHQSGRHRSPHRTIKVRDPDAQDTRRNRGEGPVSPNDQYATLPYGLSSVSPFIMVCQMYATFRVTILGRPCPLQTS